MVGEAAEQALLSALVGAGVRLLVFGGQGLRLRFPEALADYRRPDLDLLLGPGELRRFVAIAQAQGWQVESWGAPWQAGWDEAALQGRWYVRAVQDGLQVDATFECPFFSVEAALQRAVWCDGVPVCPLEELWGVKLIKDAAKARAFAAAWGLSIPPSAEALYLRHAAIDGQLDALDEAGGVAGQEEGG